MTTQERIASLHERANVIKRRREERFLRVWGGLSAGLAGALMIAVCVLIRTPHSVLNGTLTGTSMLSDSAGGYVLVGVISFVLAVFITVVCMRRHRDSQERGHPGSVRADDSDLKGREYMG